MADVTLPAPVAIAGGALCLRGDAVADLPGAEQGVLCGTWQRNQGAATPVEGDQFRFVTMTSEGDAPGETATFIYGDVLPGG